LESDVLTAEEIEPRYELRGIESPFLAAELDQTFAEREEEPEEEESWSEEAEEPPSAGSNGVLTFDAQTLPMRVAVYVTQAARQAREVEVLLYAHGLDVCRPVLKNRPVTFITGRPFRLGQLVESSGRPIVLVVPFLDWEHLAKNNLSFGHKWHKLAQPKNLNGVIAEALAKANVAPIGRLILAGHSRAYGIFDAMARLHADPEMTDGALAKLTHVWALDSTYSSPVADWMKWLRSRSGLRMTVIYRYGTYWSKKTASEEPLVTGVHGDRFKRAKDSRGRMTVIPVAAGKVDHCAIPGHYLPELLSLLSTGSAPATSEELFYLDEELYADDRLDAEDASELYEDDEADAELFEETPESLVDDEGDQSESFGGDLETDEEIAEEIDEEIDQEAEDEFVGELEVEEAPAAVVVFPSGASLPIVTGLPAAKGQDYWDPTGSKNPLLDTGPAHKDKRLSTHFTVRELTKTGGASADVARIDPKLVECVQRIRDHVDQPITITSGYRSWKRNKQVYAAMKDEHGNPRKPTLSQHCGGRAVDITIAGMNGLAIGRAAIEAYGPDIGIGLGNSFAHIDVRGVAAAWNYGGAKDSWVAEIKQLQRNTAKGVPSPSPQRSSTAPVVVPHKSTMSEAERRKHIAAAIDQARTAGTSADRASIAATLKANGTDVDTWFGGMVPDATFLGRAIRASGGKAPGVHRALFEALQRAERTLLDQYPGRTAEQLGKEMGIYDIAGLRPPKKATGGTLPSYHCFGLAIDINHDTNPFVGNMKPKKDSARYEEFLANRSPRVIERAMWLLRGEKFDVEKAIAGSVGAVWDVHHRVSDTLAEYLRLADDPGGARLQSLVTKAQASGDAKTLAWWKNRLTTDRAMLPHWDFQHHKRPEKTGYMDLSRDVVVALAGAGLLWGGQYRTGKDIMHFDMRNGPIRNR
ncbi:MAG TPA: D-Ala-D-Ala carboxypeptidase family metallohydrolase, partial [Thermoanaerobaculia bacterium]